MKRVVLILLLSTKPLVKLSNHSIGVNYPVCNLINYYWLCHKLAICFDKLQKHFITMSLCAYLIRSQVQLKKYNRDKLEKSVLWTTSKRLDDSYRAVSAVDNTHLLLDAAFRDIKLSLAICVI